MFGQATLIWELSIFHESFILELLYLPYIPSAIRTVLSAGRKYSLCVLTAEQPVCCVKLEKEGVI